MKWGAALESGAGDVLTVLRRVTEEVVAEIQRSFEFYLASAGDEPIERLYLSGGVAASRVEPSARVAPQTLG